MPDETPAAAVTTAPATAAPATAAPATAWHAGIEPELLGHWQNKGLDISDPAKVAIEMTKQHRAAEKHFGVPADQLLKMPKADAPEADLKAFYQRLGAPADPKDYDFSAIKLNGQPLDDAFAAAMRASLAAAYVPKDKAPVVAQGVAKFLEDTQKAQQTEFAAKLEIEKAELAKQWGNNFEFNKLRAMEAARRGGLSLDGATALENCVGYANVMEFMRKVGMGTTEASFIDGNSGTAGHVVTRDGAIARRDELQSDATFRQRLFSGDKAASRELHHLEAMINGETPLY